MEVSGGGAMACSGSDELWRGHGKGGGPPAARHAPAGVRKGGGPPAAAQRCPLAGAQKGGGPVAAARRRPPGHDWGGGCGDFFFVVSHVGMMKTSLSPGGHRQGDVPSRSINFRYPTHVPPTPVNTIPDLFLLPPVHSVRIWRFKSQNSKQRKNTIMSLYG